MEEKTLGKSQNTILAGGRYDYLALHFGYGRGDSLAATGWAAGMNRITLLLDYMKNSQLISIADHPSPSQQACIAVVCHLEKSEQSYGPQVR